MVNNVLITSLNTKYLCNNCCLWIRFLLILEIKTAFKVWSNQHVIFCTFCFDWHKLLYGSYLILFSVLKTTHIMPTVTKGYGYISDAISYYFHTNNLLFFIFSSTLSFLCSVLSSSLIWAMAATPPSAKRMKTRVVRSGGKLEGWFSRESELINKYLHETSRKIVNTPKLVSFTWMKQQNLSTVRSLLKEQRLKGFLELTGNIYPDLVKVFILTFNLMVTHLSLMWKVYTWSLPIMCGLLWLDWSSLGLESTEEI